MYMNPFQNYMQSMMSSALGPMMRGFNAMPLNNSEKSQFTDYIKSGQLTDEKLNILRNQARNLGIPEPQINQGLNFINQLRNS